MNDTPPMVPRGLISAERFNRLVSAVESGRAAVSERSFNSTRGVLFRKPRRPRRRVWPGYCYLGPIRWYELGRTDDTTGSAISDSSSGEKLWLVADLAANSFLWMSGPPPHPLPDHQIWYYIPHWDVPIYVNRMG